jgi:hypothetical protein
MRKTIVRTIVASTINSANVSFANGKPEVKDNAPIVVNGTIEEVKAVKEVRKAYGETAYVTGINEVNDVYEISVEDFMKYATKVIAPTPEEVKEGEVKEG